jgi:hypothetical protein
MAKLLPNLSFLLLPTLLQACSYGPTSIYRTTPAGTETTVSLKRRKMAKRLRTELLATEQRDPSTYLEVVGTYSRNFSRQLVLEGDIESKASIATFKDPVLSVTWYSKTQTEIGTQQYSVYELLRPQSSAHFKLETAAPGEVASVIMGVYEATPVE